MRTFKEFVTLCEQTYDKEMGQTIKKIGTGVKVGAERKKTAPEKRRMKAAGGGKMVPAKDYKARKDIGQQRKAETRVQQPTKERPQCDLSSFFHKRIHVCLCCYETDWHELTFIKRRVSKQDDTNPDELGYGAYKRM